MFGFIPHNIELYKLALIHKSASVTLDNGQHINNERLEFLGDAVIETVTSDYLFIEHPDKNEGFLTQMRSKMVSRQSLNAVAKRLGLDDHVITHSTNNSSQKHIYGDAFEAMMGAIYLDQGYDFVNRLLINKIFAEYLKPDTLVESETDFKSRLIEWCQKNHHSIHFATAHDKTYSASHPFFYSKVLIDGIEVGYGAGESKKEAEQRAAFSVSQGINDADCNKLMDKLDNIEGHSSKSESKPQRPAKQKPSNSAPKQESEPIAEKEEEKSLENEAQPQEKEAKPQENKPKRTPRTRKPKAEREAKPAAEVAEDAVAAEPTTTTEESPKAENEANAEEVAKARKPRSRRRRSTAKKTTAEADSTTITPTTEE
ncbi:MAG: ribonuclease III [Alistipes sp.]|nr:ribonuclease III [Alistipes sp.]